MNGIIIQIIPATVNMRFGYDGGKTRPVTCLALVELENGDREIHAMGLMNGGVIEDLAGTEAIRLDT